jgi:prepilin-type N-terminal cleavage/methylation domain-containing protein
MSVKRHRGFTLAELLISLAILGVIATFTIPKILSAQQSSQYNATAHEVAGMISGAFQQYQFNNSSVPSTFSVIDLTQYINYVSVDTTSTIVAQGVVDCTNAGWLCLKLHSGGTLYAWKADQFGGTSSLNAIPIGYDPGPPGTMTGPTRLPFYLYYNGSIRTKSTVLAGTTYSGGAITSSADPSWFQW